MFWLSLDKFFSRLHMTDAYFRCSIVGNSSFVADALMDLLRNLNTRYPRRLTERAQTTTALIRPHLNIATHS
jgi:hypothetical protein